MREYDVTLRKDGTLFIRSYRISVAPYWHKISFDPFLGMYHTVRIGGSGRKVCDEAFMEYSIPNLYVEDRYREIGARAFAFCRDLSTVHLSESLEEIGECAFRGCESLNEIEIPGWVHYMGDRVFWQCTGLEKAVFAGNLQVLPKGTFENCISLHTVELPQKLKVIGPAAFKNCLQLERIRIPDTVEELGDHAFTNCWNLQEIRIPAGTRFNISTFIGCGGLERIIVDPNHPEFRSHGSLVLNKVGTRVCFAAEGISGICEIPEGIQALNAYAFSECGHLTEVRMPSSVSEMKEFCFKSCPSLQEVSLSEKIGTIPEGCFANCKGLKRIVLPNGVKAIQDEAFEGSGLEEIVFPASMEQLGKGCFRNTPLKLVIAEGDNLDFLNPRGASIPATFSLRAEHVPLDQVPNPLKKAVARDFILRREAKEPVTKEQLQWALAYIKGHVQTLWKDPEFRNTILHYGHITARSYPKIMELTLQEKDTEMTARLLEYREKWGLGEKLDRIEANKVKRELKRLDEAASEGSEAQDT